MDKNELVSKISLMIANEEKITLSSSEKKLFDEIVFDFPLMFESESAFKSEKLTEQEIFSSLTEYVKHMTFYNDKIYNVNSKTKFPLSKSIVEIPKQYISSSRLNKEEIIDFVGNAANSQYYKTLKRLIVQDGKYLKDGEGYVFDNLSSFVQNRIKIFEKWYSQSINVIQKGFLDTTNTQQIMIPINGSYISVSPAQSMGMVRKVMESNREFSNNNFELRKKKNEEMKKIISSIKSLSKNKEKTADFKASLKALSEELKAKQEEISQIPFLKTAQWQTSFSKPQLLGMVAPSFKRGIYLADMPNYNVESAKKIHFEKAFQSFIKKVLIGLKHIDKSDAEKENLFKILEGKLSVLLEKYKIEDVVINSTDKNSVIRYILILFSIFKRTMKKDKRDIDKFTNEKKEEVLVSFISYLKELADNQLHYEFENKVYNLLKQEIKWEK